MVVVFDTTDRDKAERVQRFLRRSNIASSLGDSEGRWRVTVDEAHASAALGVMGALDRVDRPEALTGLRRDSVMKRAFRLENLGVAVALVVGLAGLGFYLWWYGSTLAMFGVGALIVVVGAVGAIGFGGMDGPSTSSEPRRVGRLHGPLTQDDDARVSYRQAWARQVRRQIVRPRERPRDD